MYICISKHWTCSSWSCLLNFTCSYHFGDLHPMMFYMYIYTARMRRTRSEVSMINTAQTARMTSRLLILYSCAMWIEPRLCTFSCLVYIKVYNSFVLVSTIFPWCGCWLLLPSAQGLQFFFPPPPLLISMPLGVPTDATKRCELMQQSVTNRCKLLHFVVQKWENFEILMRKLEFLHYCATAYTVIVTSVWVLWHGFGYSELALQKHEFREGNPICMRQWNFPPNEKFFHGHTELGKEESIWNTSSGGLDFLKVRALYWTWSSCLPIRQSLRSMYLPIWKRSSAYCYLQLLCVHSHGKW